MKTLAVVVVLAAVAIGAAVHYAGRSAEKTTTTLLAIPDQASRVAARADVSAALPALQTFAAENGGYAGLTVDALRRIDPSVASTASLRNLSASGYCLQVTVGTATASVTGPGGAITDGPCP
jgi:Tfp pilus assembly protein PilE